MPDVLTTLTAAAVAIFRERQARPYKDPHGGYFSPRDAVLRAARDFAYIESDRHPEIETVGATVFAEPDLKHLGPAQGQLAPMILHAGGGVRTSPEALVVGLFVAAYLQLFYLRLPAGEGTYVRAVLEGFEEFRRAARGESVRAYAISGIAGIKLPQSRQITTPWGILHPTPPVEPEPMMFMVHESRCLFVEPRLLSVRFDRAGTPQHDLDRSELDSRRSEILFPLACALGGADAADPPVPLVIWSTLLLPFQGSFSFSAPLYPGRFKTDIEVGDQIPTIEDWSRVIERSHAPSADIAARRLATAVAHRADPSDALIDAAMVWENLVGTDIEVSFRVTAALAKALEATPSARRVLRRSLRDIYNLRSRVVHGTAVQPAKIADASREAIEVAVKALRVFYRRGPAWLAMSSTERADTLLLEDP